MSSEEAFNYIPNVVEILFILEDDFLIWNSLYFLIELYYKARTTEIHKDLYTNWRPLCKHISKFHDSYAKPFQDLKRTLRIQGDVQWS
jgi:hypothetical protein